MTKANEIGASRTVISAIQDEINAHYKGMGQ